MRSRETRAAHPSTVGHEVQLKHLKSPIVILCTFVAFQIYRMIVFLYAGNRPQYLYAIRVLVPFVMAIVSYFAIRGKSIQGRKILLWIMGINLLAQFPAIFWGLSLPFHQYVLKTLAVVLGSYFTFGGVLIIRQAMRLE